MYDYSKVEYVNYETKVCIICPEHGEFWQRPHGHLSGQGCPFCNSSKLEILIGKLLREKNIKYERFKTFRWLFNKGHLYLDFYLPDYNAAIECQGIQHFEPVEFYGGIDGFLNRQKCDQIKFKLCNEHEIKIFYYSNAKHNEYFSEIYENGDDLIKKIYEQNRRNIY